MYKASSHYSLNQIIVHMVLIYIRKCYEYNYILKN
jgi:hypothetical protein